MFPIVVIVAQLAAAPMPLQRAYGKLTPAELQAKRTTKRPRRNVRFVASALQGHSQ